MTKQGKIAVLTNFREEGVELIEGARSRGEIPSAYLTVPPDRDESPEQFAYRLIEEDGVHGVGGFSLAFGQLKRLAREGEEAGVLNFVSNRTPNVQGLKHSPRRGTWGLSNSHYGDRAWPKVVDGERLLGEVVQADTEGEQELDELIEKCFEVLSTDTLPKKDPDEEFQIYVRQLRHSIFIPAVGGDESGPKISADLLAAAREQTPMSKATSGVYGTQRQTVILVDRLGKATFVERTLYDGEANAVAETERDRRFDFDIEGWQD